MPVDFVYVSGKTFYAEVYLPGGYHVSYLPAALHEDNDFISIVFKCDAQQDRIVVAGSYNFKLKTYPADQYNTLKYFMNEIIKSFNDKIVLESNPSR